MLQLCKNLHRDLAHEELSVRGVCCCAFSVLSLRRQAMPATVDCMLICCPRAGMLSEPELPLLLGCSGDPVHSGASS